MTNTPKLSLTEYASLLARGATIHFNRASLQIKERCFVMEGPSGMHSLLADATDLDRLNAHWTAFATDSRNAYAA